MFHIASSSGRATISSMTIVSERAFRRAVVDGMGVARPLDERSFGSVAASALSPPTGKRIVETFNGHHPKVERLAPETNETSAR